MIRVQEASLGNPCELNGPIVPVEVATLKQHAPTAHYCCLDSDRLVGRCSIWISDSGLAQPKTGIIGHYAVAHREASNALLGHAIEQLKSRGCASAIGPMDGNTWRRYRLLTRRGSEPSFFLEPDNPDDWPDHFRAMGFAPLAEYFSSLDSDLSVIDPRVPAAMARMAQQGITFRPIRMEQLEEELKAVHALSLDAFANNFLYSPVSQQEFLAMYQSLRAHLRPQLILMAEDFERRLVGFVFGLPDLAQAQRGERITRAICKTVAVRPGRTGAGLGSVLIDRFQQAARAAGFTAVVHALMHESNQSMKIAARYGTIIRGYTLFSRRLDP